jgi:Rrf2 family transcriptional regulator, cysteine metabolism repressor
VNVPTKSEYGLRALIYLATHADQGLVPAREIAERWHVPVKYLEQILRILREGGLVEGQVGVGGGYRLTRPASAITAGEAVRLLDGRIAPMGGLSTHQSAAGEFELASGLHRLWARTQEAMLAVLDGTTIADLGLSAGPALTVSPETKRAG